MGQYDILEFLKKKKGAWFSSKEIAKKLKLNPSTVTMSLKKLRKSNLVKYKQQYINENKQGKRMIYMYRY